MNYGHKKAREHHRATAIYRDSHKMLGTTGCDGA